MIDFYIYLFSYLFICLFNINALFYNLYITAYFHGVIFLLFFRSPVLIPVFRIDSLWANKWKKTERGIYIYIRVTTHQDFGRKWEGNSFQMSFGRNTRNIFDIGKEFCKEFFKELILAGMTSNILF